MTKVSFNRVLFLVSLWGLVFLIMGCRLFYLQVIKYSYYRNESRKWQENPITLPAQRGTIFDRKGRVIAQDISLEYYVVIPQYLNNHEKADSILSYYLGKPRGFLLELLKRRNEYTYLDTVSTELSAKIWRAIVRSGITNGIEKHLVYKRIYPYGEIGAHIIGFWGNEPEGIEAMYENLLKGKPGLAIRMWDCINTLTIEPPQPGCDIYLTIDIDVQAALERELKNAVESSGGKSGAGVAVIPETGEILALCSYPSFDPNKFSKYPDDARRNRVVTDPFEPGSIFKVVPLAMILENSIVKEDDSIFCHNGLYVEPKMNIKIRDVHPYGWLTVEDVIVKSSNIGTLKLSLLAPPESLYSMIKRFGFGSKTGIELPSEASGFVPLVANWEYSRRLNIPFGQGIMVTPLQIVEAYSGIANDGVRIRPYLVKRIINPNTKEEIVSDRKELLFSDREKFLRIYGTKVISPETALRIRKILLEVVKRGTGKSAYIPGLEICGKTGTAQKAINGVYTDKSFASFVGMAPCEKPRIIAMIIVDEPQKAFQFGGVASAPYVGRFISRLSAIAPEYIPAGVSSEPKIAKVESVSTPNLVMLYKEQAEKLLRWLELEPVFMGNGNIVLSQMPPEKTSLKKGEKVYLTLGNANNLSLNNNNDKKLVPDLCGMPIRKAILLLWSMNIPFKIIGNGVVKSQEPSPGGPIGENEICLLRCSLE